MKIGDKVILGSWDGPGFYSEMLDFVGTVAILHQAIEREVGRCWYVKGGGSKYWWYEGTMKLVSENKKYTNECPCGIHPSRCDYHKDL